MFIHISGTNGKGSVLASVPQYCPTQDIGQDDTYHQPCFLYRERIQVDGEKIEKESLAKHVTAIALAIENMKKEHLGSPTAFEVEADYLFFILKKNNAIL